MGPSCYLGPFVLIEGRFVTYRNCSCEAGPGSGNNIMVIRMISTNLQGPPHIDQSLFSIVPHL